MLVALLRANPNAFIGGNVNRIKAGAVLDVPARSRPLPSPAAEARSTIIAQSRDFNEFRRRLADNAPTSQMAGADRQAAGKLQANVEDESPPPPPPDKLTLSKGAVQGKAAEESSSRSTPGQGQPMRAWPNCRRTSRDLNKLEAATSTAAGSGTRLLRRPVPHTPAAAAAAALPAHASAAPLSAAAAPLQPGSTAAAPQRLPGRPQRAPRAAASSRHLRAVVAVGSGRPPSQPAAPAAAAARNQLLRRAAGQPPHSGRLPAA